MNRYVISDIHGCSLTLQELLSKIRFSKNDELILLGDYINRGKRSKEVLDTIMELQNQAFNVVALRGNHEDMVFDSLELEEWTAGETETLHSFGIGHLKELDNKYIKWLSSLKSYHEDEEFIFVHAGLNFTRSNPLDDEPSMRWLVDWHGTIDYTWLRDRTIIHGHQEIDTNKILRMKNMRNEIQVINIDNGCYLKGKENFGNLCCLHLNTMDVIFQENVD